MTTATTDPLSSLHRLKANSERGITHAAGSPIYDNAVKALRELGILLAPYEAIDAGLLP